LIATGKSGAKNLVQIHVEAEMALHGLYKIQKKIDAELKRLGATDIKAVETIVLAAAIKHTVPAPIEFIALIGPNDYSVLIDLYIQLQATRVALIRDILGYEKMTDWHSVDVPADDYFPMQVDGPSMDALFGDTAALGALIRQMNETRLQTSLASTELNREVLLLMGVFDLDDIDTVFLKGRRVVPSELAEGAFDAETLSRLNPRPMITGTKGAPIKIADPTKDFSITTGDITVYYSIPTRKDQLSAADLKKHDDTDKGSKAHWTPQWKQKFHGQVFGVQQMFDMLQFKAKRGPYHAARPRKKDDRPDIAIGSNEARHTGVQNFTLAEALKQ